MNTEKSEKKAYVSPSMEEIDVECRMFLCDSCENSKDCMDVLIGD